MSIKVAILDDFQGVACTFGDWSRVEQRGEITVFRDHLADEDAIVERLRDYDCVVIMRERTPFPRSLLERLPKLKLIATSAMWNRVIDLDYCHDRGIIVSGTQGSGGGTAQLTFALILALLQQIPQCDRDVRAGLWQTGIGYEAQHKTIGIIGLGRVGAKVAQIARAFDMQLIAWSQNLTAEKAAACGAELVSKEELFRRADVVTLHLVLSERTRHVVGAPEIGLMKPTAYFINTSRGPLVDGAALDAALRAGRVAGAGLDVFDTEPLPPNAPLLSAPNTILTPHIGYVSRESYEVFYAQMAEDVAAWLDGAPIRRIFTSEVADKAAAAPAH